MNKYTLQHNKYDNIFAFGDAVGFETTRTHTGAIAQNPIIKNNLLRFMQGKECNGVYDGYVFQPLLLGHSYATSFAHLHDFEPAPRNHIIPHYGIFSRWYFGNMVKGQMKEGEAYASFKKNHGPPHSHFSAEYDDLEHNELLKAKGISPSELIHPNFEARQAARLAAPADDHHH